MVRPRREAVHEDRSGQAAHQGRNEALPPPPRAGTMTAVCPAGQVTVARSSSTVNRSLGNGASLTTEGYSPATHAMIESDKLKDSPKLPGYRIA